jgi:hypothetical protein
MEISYKPPFRKFVKKQARPLQLVIEDAVEEIAGHPEKGELKKGDLAGFRVYKFTFHKQMFLIAYRFQTDTLCFYMIGTHENFYLNLKRYLRETL